MQTIIQQIATDLKEEIKKRFLCVFNRQHFRD